MVEVKIAEICGERLLAWGEILVEKNSTPFALIGVGHNSRSGQLHMCICEGIPNEAVAEILRAAADQLDP